MLERLAAFRLVVTTGASNTRRIRTVFASSREAAMLMIHVPKGGRVTLSPVPDVEEAWLRMTRLRKPGARDLRGFYMELKSALYYDRALPNAFRIVLPNIENALLANAVAAAVDPSVIGKGSVAMLECLRNVLPSEHIERLNAAVSTGETGPVVDQLCRSMDKGVRIRGKIVQALIEPTLTLMAAMGVAIFIALVQAPAMAALFSSQKSPLPAPTQVLLQAVSIIKAFPLLAVVIVGAPAFVLWALPTLYGSSPWFQEIVDSLPQVGPLIEKVRVSKMLRTLSMLLQSNVSTSRALAMTVRTTAHFRTRSFLTAVGATIEAQGTSFYDAAMMHRDKLKESEARWLDLLPLGSTTGTLGELLVGMADDYEDRADNAIDILPKLLYYLAIMGSGLIVGFVVIAAVLPGFRLAAIMH